MEVANITAGQMNLKERAANTTAISTTKIQNTTLWLLSILYTNELYRIRARTTPPHPAAKAIPNLKNFARRRPPIMLITKHTENTTHPVTFELSRFMNKVKTKRVDARVNTVVPTTNKEILKKRFPRIPRIRPNTIREQPRTTGWSPKNLTNGFMLKT